jgi:hypothetical protein
VRVVDRQPFRGPTTVALGEQTQTIGHELASMLFCAPAAR